MKESILQTKREIAPDKRVGIQRIGHRQTMVIVGICLAISATEYIFAYQNVAHGIVIALGMVLVIYLSISVFRLDDRIVRCAESLALIPLYILFTSSLPWFFIDQEYLLPAVYSCILGLCLWHVYQKKLSPKEIFGFRRSTLLRYVLFGIIIGAPMGVGEYFILRPEAAYPTFEVKYLLRDMVYMLFFVCLAEEVLFRGFIQIDFSRAFGWKWGLFGASVMFAVMHLTWRSVPELGFVFIAGMVLGYLYIKTRSLIAPIVAHAANNVMLVAIAPYVFMR